MTDPKITPELKRLAKVYLEEREQKLADDLVSVRYSLKFLDGEEKLSWSFLIVSPYKNMGKNHKDEVDFTGDFTTATLREAIREAATEYCILNRRVYPGYVSESTTWPRWDVQATWHVRLKVGQQYIPLPEEMWQNHVDELRRVTRENYSPEFRNRRNPLPLVP